MTFGQDDFCYLCGSKDNLTKEHIPPHNLSPRSSQEKFIILPTCVSCNRSLSHEESKFRDYLAAVSIQTGNKSVKDAYENMQRSFKRNDLARAGRIHKDEMRLIENRIIKDYLSSLGIYMGTKTAIIKPDELDDKAVVKKIVKGLLFYTTKVLLDDNYLVEGMLIPESQPNAEIKARFQNVYRFTGINGSCGDFFKYWGAGNFKTPLLATQWYMEFYGHVKAWGSVMHKDI